MRLLVIASLIALVGCIQTSRKVSEFEFLRALDYRIDAGDECDVREYIRSQPWALQRDDELAEVLNQFLSRSRQPCAAGDTDRSDGGLTLQLSEAISNIDPVPEDSSMPISRTRGSKNAPIARDPRGNSGTTTPAAQSSEPAGPTSPTPVSDDAPVASDPGANSGMTMPEATSSESAGPTSPPPVSDNAPVGSDSGVNSGSTAPAAQSRDQPRGRDRGSDKDNDRSKDKDRSKDNGRSKDKGRSKSNGRTKN